MSDFEVLLTAFGIMFAIVLFSVVYGVRRVRKTGDGFVLLWGLMFLALSLLFLAGILVMNALHAF